MNHFEQDLKNLSMTGRLCYLFMCVEAYLVTCYPERNWTPVAKRCWQWTKDYWDTGWDIYSAVVPEFLFEFDSYEKTNQSFEGQLPETDYWELIHVFNGITTGNAEDEINQILMLPIEFGNRCEGADFAQASNLTWEIFDKMRQFLYLHKIPLPDMGKVQTMTADQKHGWGDFVDSEFLSIIIKP